MFNSIVWVLRLKDVELEISEFRKFGFKVLENNYLGLTHLEEMPDVRL